MNSKQRGCWILYWMICFLFCTFNNFLKRSQTAPTPLFPWLQLTTVHFSPTPMSSSQEDAVVELDLTALSSERVYVLGFKFVCDLLFSSRVCSHSAQLSRSAPGHLHPPLACIHTPQHQPFVWTSQTSSLLQALSLRLPPTAFWKALFEDREVHDFIGFVKITSTSEQVLRLMPLWVDPRATVTWSHNVIT